MKTMILAVSFLAAALLPAAAQAAKIRVPADFPTIQAAVNATTGYGDVIEVSQGTYLEAVSLVFKDELTLQAKKGHKVIIQSAAATPLTVSLSSCVHVKNLRLEGATGSSGLDVNLSNDVLVEGCSVSGSGQDGIRILLCGGVTVEDCTVKWVTGSGILVYGDNVCLLGNTVLHAGWNGMRLEGLALTVDGNTIKDCGQRGIVLGLSDTTTEGALVVKNRIDGAAQDGIYLDTGADSCVILSNTILRGDDDGIEVALGAADNVLQQNNVSSTIGDGFEVHCWYGSFCKNKVKKAGNDGFWVAGDSSHCLFFKNTITSSASDGFQVNGQDSTYMQNTANKNSGWDCVLYVAPGTNAFIDNKFGTIAE